VCLLEISRLKSDYSNDVYGFGFSGHHLGISIDNAAYTLGATWIERHFTKDRTWKGTDHAASLEPSGMSKLVRDLNATSDSLQLKPKQILEIEEPQRKKLKYRGV
jgi:N-acetylneuraminate synthase